MSLRILTIFSEMHTGGRKPTKSQVPTMGWSEFSFFSYCDMKEKMTSGVRTKQTKV